MTERDHPHAEEFISAHRMDADGNPAGGMAWGPGFCITWQDGSLGQGDDRQLANGAFPETVLGAVRDRFQFFQNSTFACPENEAVIAALDEAIRVCEQRTADRQQRGVEGLHEV